MTRRLIAGCIVALVASGLTLGLDAGLTWLADGSGSQWLQTLEMETYDWRLARTARPSEARQDIALIEIDEYSLRNLEPNAGRWPWPRVVHSMLIDYLTRAPAKLIVYDINFAEPDSRRGFDFGGSTISGADSDQALIESVRNAGNVILVADATYEAATGEGPELPDSGIRLASARGALNRKVVFPPFAALAGAASGLGHSLLMLDPDGPVRHTVPLVRSQERVIPSLGLAAAMRAANIDAAAVRLSDDVLSIGDRSMPLLWRTVRTEDGPDRFLWGTVNFRGPGLLADRSKSTYPRYAFFDLLYANEQILASVAPDIDPSVFRDKIVFVGATASGIHDVFETPFASGRMPGMQVHAAAADDVLSNRFLWSAGDGVRVALVLGVALIIGLIASIVPAVWATLVSVVLIGAFGWVSVRLFATGVWLNVSQPFLAASLAMFGGVGYQYIVEGSEKRKMKRLFGQYVSKDVFDHLVAHPELAHLGGHRREMSVLFSDLRGFTTLSENGQPEAIVGLLNEYFTRMVDLVFQHKGTLDKFVGDMVMALYGAPLDDPRHADHAVETAVDMIVELDALNRRWRQEGRPALDIGIGVNTGAMIAGNIGSESIMSYTVIGDAVNLGSRLESLNKQYGTRIIISDATRRQLTRPYRMRSLGTVVVKGKSSAVEIFEVLGREDLNLEASDQREAHV